MLRSLCCLLGVLATAACSSAEDGRPPVTNEEPPTPVVSISATEQETCTAGETRECRAYWTDATKQLHCTQATQFCDTSGHWLECGAQP